jgi:hypothetical protein
MKDISVSAVPSESDELDLSKCVRKLHALGKYFLAWVGSGSFPSYNPFTFINTIYYTYFHRFY